MKILVIMMGLTLFSGFSLAGKDCDGGHCNQMSGHPKDGLGDFTKLANLTKRQEGRYAMLAQQICNYYTTEGGNLVNAIVSTIKEEMHRYFGYDRNPTKPDMVAFFNDGMQAMKCGDKSYMKVALDVGKHQTLFRAIYGKEIIQKRPENHRININAISYTGPGGSAQTTLDYMMDIRDGRNGHSGYSQATREQVRSLIVRFTKFYDAKTYNQLPASIKARFPKYKKRKT